MTAAVGSNRPLWTPTFRTAVIKEARVVVKEVSTEGREWDSKADHKDPKEIRLAALLILLENEVTFTSGQLSDLTGQLNAVGAVVEATELDKAALTAILTMEVVRCLHGVDVATPSRGLTWETLQTTFPVKLEECEDDSEALDKASAALDDFAMEAAIVESQAEYQQVADQGRVVHPVLVSGGVCWNDLDADVQKQCRDALMLIRLGQPLRSLLNPPGYEADLLELMNQVDPHNPLESGMALGSSNPELVERLGEYEKAAALMAARMPVLAAYMQNAKRFLEPALKSIDRKVPAVDGQLDAGKDPLEQIGSGLSALVPSQTVGDPKQILSPYAGALVALEVPDDGTIVALFFELVCRHILAKGGSYSGPLPSQEDIVSSQAFKQWLNREFNSPVAGNVQSEVNQIVQWLQQIKAWFEGEQAEMKREQAKMEAMAEMMRGLDVNGAGPSSSGASSSSAPAFPLDGGVGPSGSPFAGFPGDGPMGFPGQAGPTTGLHDVPARKYGPHHLMHCQLDLVRSWQEMLPSGDGEVCQTVRKWVEERLAHIAAMPSCADFKGVELSDEAKIDYAVAALFIRDEIEITTTMEKALKLVFRSCTHGVFAIGYGGLKIPLPTDFSGDEKTIAQRWLGEVVKVMGEET